MEAQGHPISAEGTGEIEAAVVVASCLPVGVALAVEASGEVGSVEAVLEIALAPARRTTTQGYCTDSRPGGPGSPECHFQLIDKPGDQIAGNQIKKLAPGKKLIMSEFNSVG